MTKKIAVVFAASLVLAAIAFALLRGGIGQHERERSETKHATEAQAGSGHSESQGHDKEKSHPWDEEQCRMRKDERGLPYVPIYDEKGMSKTASHRESTVWCSAGEGRMSSVVLMCPFSTKRGISNIARRRKNWKSWNVCLFGRLEGKRYGLMTGLLARSGSRQGDAMLLISIHDGRNRLAYSSKGD